MSLVILLGILMPIIYVMVKIVSNVCINKKIVLNTLAIAVIGMLISAIAMSIVNHSVHLTFYLVASCLVGIVWGLILCGCYYCYQTLSNLFINNK